MLVVWVKDNIPDRYDVAWLKAGGGLFGRSGSIRRAGRFNAGQKLIFWSVVLGGIALSVTGIIMLFPFSFADVNGMQLAQIIHAVVGVLLIAVMIAHIYIGIARHGGRLRRDGLGRGRSRLGRSTTAPGSRRRATPERHQSEPQHRPNSQPDAGLHRRRRGPSENREEMRRMGMIVTGVVAAFAIAIGASYFVGAQGDDRSAWQVYSSSSARVGDPGENWSGLDGRARGRSAQPRRRTL